MQSIKLPQSSFSFIILQARVYCECLNVSGIIRSVDVQVNSPLSPGSEAAQQPEVRLKQEGASSPDDRQVGVTAYGQISVSAYIKRLRGRVQQSPPRTAAHRVAPRCWSLLERR